MAALPPVNPKDFTDAAAPSGSEIFPLYQGGWKRVSLTVIRDWFATLFGSKSAEHTHSNKTTLDSISGTNTGDQDLSGLSPLNHDHDGVYDPANSASSAVSGHESTYIHSDIAKLAASQTDNHVPSGFIDHSTSTLSLVENVGAVNDTFTVTITGTAFPVYIDGTLYLKDTESVTQAGALSKRYFIFYDAGTQDLTIADSSWDLESGSYDGSAPVCTVLWDAVNHQGILEEERHHSWRDIHWHHWAHHTTGPQYSTAHYGNAYALTGNANFSTFSVSPGSMYDEDVRNDLAVPATTCNLFYHNPTGGMLFIKGSASPFLLVGGVPQYDNGVGVANKSASNVQGYFVSWMYATNAKDSNGNSQIAVVIGQDNDANMTLTEAQNAPFPSLPTHFVLEWKLLYKMIYRWGAGNNLTHISNTDYRIAGTLPSGQAPTSNVSAASVIFAPTTTITATNVQAALEMMAPVPPMDGKIYVMRNQQWEELSIT